jgi:hypothetical protein
VQSLLRKCFLGQSKGDLENASSNLDVVMKPRENKSTGILRSAPYPYRSDRATKDLPRP